MNQKNEITKQLVRTLFKDDYGNPLELTDGQIEIFNSIWLKEDNRVNVIAPTQYGKSTVLACALILRTRATGEIWAIVAGRADKARIIMEKVIQHTFDNDLLIENLALDKNEPLERLKRERSKDRIVWKSGGEIRIFSAQTKSAKNVNDALTGFGSPNIVEDESALIPDPFQSMILRMLGGHADNTLIKVGNPFYRNHFYKTSNSPLYKKIRIDYEQAMREGRYTQEFIDEARDAMTFQEFDVLYGCNFPSDTIIDQYGYYRLLSDVDVYQSQEEGSHSGELRLGVDIGEGGDENVAVLRSAKYAEIVHFSRISDLMATTKVIVDLIDKYRVRAENCFIDATGIGAGVVSRLKELGLNVTGVKWAEKAKKDIYANLKAENFMLMQQSFRDGLKLKPHTGWSELTQIKWQKDTGDKIKIKSKEQMRKEGIKSPNVADALALTFNPSIEQEAPQIWTL